MKAVQTGEQDLICHYRSDSGPRRRSLGRHTLSAILDLPKPTARLLADWQRECMQHLALQPGDVEVMPLARARARWNGFAACFQSVAHWMSQLGLPAAALLSDVSLMACRGAWFHHDVDPYGAAAFCNLFLTDDKGWDLHFPSTGERMNLAYGTAVLFDPSQPHGVVRRGTGRFEASTATADEDDVQVFLSWELPIEQSDLAQALGVVLDAAPLAPSGNEPCVRWRGAPVSPCPETGRWLPVPAIG